jgi:hypothetical protein
MTSKPKKTKRDNRIVAYVRMLPTDHAQITKIAQQRGYPHTFASVVSEVISDGVRALKEKTKLAS